MPLADVYIALKDVIPHLTRSPRPERSRRGRPVRPAPARPEPGFLIHIFERVGLENGIEHRLTKPCHPWTNGQAERMVRTIKEATVKSFHYASLNELRRNVRDWLIACNFAKQLKALRFRTPYEAIEELWNAKPDAFIVQPNHHTLGLNR